MSVELCCMEESDGEVFELEEEEIKKMSLDKPSNGIAELRRAYKEKYMRDWRPEVRKFPNLDGLLNSLVSLLYARYAPASF